MSEIEDLKKNTEDSLRRQRTDALIVHLTALGDAFEIALKKEKIGILYRLGGWAIWIGTSFLDSFLHSGDMFWTLGTIVYMISWMISMSYERNRALASARYMATIKVLEILGIIDPREPPGVKNKKKRIQALVDMVKGWAIKKQKAQDAVYAPA